jgi:hypothetical protein
MERNKPLKEQGRDADNTWRLKEVGAHGNASLAAEVATS